jgi:DNA polymerase III subunit alpha
MTFFSHLNVHSEYSLLESTVKIKDLIGAVTRKGMDAVALTDKYVMSGAIEFYKEAISNNMKPLIGCEVCTSGIYALSHLIILIRNKSGYENLCQLVSKSHLKRKGPLPVVELSDLRKMSEGLIGINCFKTGEISILLKAGRHDEASRSASLYGEIFRDNFFLEIQRHSGESLPESYFLIKMVNFATKYNLPLVATNNVHYLNKQDYKTYTYLFKIKTMGTKSDIYTEPVDSDEYYLKSPAEMSAMFHDIPGAISNTRLITDRCNLKIPLSGTKLSYRRNTNRNREEEKQLTKLCLTGLKWRYKKNFPREAYERLKMELGVVTQMRLCRYFLIAAGIVRFARKKNIPICGKGSSAGSIVSYVLGISDIDPVKNNLYFERFLNIKREEIPDIDIDLSSKRRNEIIKYLISLYGKTGISRICTFSTLKPVAAVREAGRIMGYGKENITGATEFRLHHDLYPDRLRLYAKNLTGTSNYQDIKNSCDEKMVRISRKIESYPRHISVHPSAFIVSTGGLEKKIPLALSKTGEIISQYDVNSIKKLGLFKIDLISSLALSLIDDVAEILKNKRNIDFNIHKIKYDDPETLNLIKDGETLGVFQLESSGIRKLAGKIRVSSADDLTHLISLYRPGPGATGMVKNFIERKSGREKVTYLHHDLKPILAETYGIILYQEQVMKIAVKIAGYSLSEADSLRKVMTGSSGEKMAGHKGKFIKGAISKGYPTDIAKKIFKLISGFSSYSFVKAHAAAYAGLSYKTCYIKAHYPAELLSVILTNNSGYYDRARYIEEARRLGIKIKLPHINKSYFRFSVEDGGKSIRIPLLTIKELGKVSVEFILNEKIRNGNFKDFTDFYYRTSGISKITKKAIGNLIKAGAFDFTGIKRKQLLLYYHYLRNLKTTKNNSEAGRIFFSHQLTCPEDFNLEEKLIIEESILGFCASCSPLYYFRDELSGYPIIKSGHFPCFLRFEKVIFTAGITINKKIKKIRNNRETLMCTMEDEDGMYTAVFFSDVLKKNLKAIMNSSALIIEGRLSPGEGDIYVIGRKAISLTDLKKAKIRTRKDIIKNNLIIKQNHYG